jgi:hypothetical protein
MGIHSMSIQRWKTDDPHHPLRTVIDRLRTEHNIDMKDASALSVDVGVAGWVTVSVTFALEPKPEPPVREWVGSNGEYGTLPDDTTPGGDCPASSLDRWPDNPLRLFCTAQAGHDGPHQAGDGDKIVAQWMQR